MPDRYIKEYHGKTQKTATLSEWAYAYYPFLQRAVCNFGCGLYNLNSIHAEMFKGRKVPSVKRLELCFEEWREVGLVEVYKDQVGADCFYLPEWFTDNSLRSGVPCCKTPPPSVVKNDVTEEEWKAGNIHAINDKLDLGKALASKQGALFPEDAGASGKLPQNTSERKGKEKKGKELKESIDLVFHHYREKIQPKARDLPAHRTKIKARLKAYSVIDLKRAIDLFSLNPWRMENNAHQGASWFFKSDTQIEKWLNLKKGSTGTNDPAYQVEG